jgi:hypothetical protein
MKTGIPRQAREGQRENEVLPHADRDLPSLKNFRLRSEAPAFTSFRRAAEFKQGPFGETPKGTRETRVLPGKSEKRFTFLAGSSHGSKVLQDIFHSADLLLTRGVSVTNLCIDTTRWLFVPDGICARPECHSPTTHYASFLFLDVGFVRVGVHIRLVLRVGAAPLHHAPAIREV